MGAPAARTPEDIARVAERVLSAEEFRHAREAPGSETQAIGELFDALVRAAQALIGDLRINHPELFAVLLIASLLVLTGSIWWGTAVLLRRRGAQGARAGAIVSPEDDPKDLRARAAALAEASDWLAAIRTLFRAVIIERALREGTLVAPAEAETFRRARTYRELVDEFSRSSPEADAMLSVADDLERGVYGGQALSRADWDRALELAKRLKGG